MREYVPTTEVVRHAVSFQRERLGEPRPIQGEAFDHWLNAVKAEAWDEGELAGTRNQRDFGEYQAMQITEAEYHRRVDQRPNPYRKVVQS